MSFFLHETLESVFGAAPSSIQPLSGGSVGEVYCVTRADGSDVVVKVDQGASPRLDFEGYMLRYLNEHSALPVPAVIHSEAQLLAIEWVDGESRFSPKA
jgi:fructosamine-3-kinase